MDGLKYWKGSEEMSCEIDIPAARRENHILWEKGYLLKGKRILRIHGKTCYRGLRIYTHRSKGGGKEILRRDVEVAGRVDGLDAHFCLPGC